MDNYEFDFLILDMDNRIFNNIDSSRNLLLFLQEKSKKCMSIASNSPIQTEKETIIIDPVSQFLPYTPPYTNRFLVLIGTKRFISTITETSYLFTNYASGEIIGHCFLTWDKRKDICGIWDICSHGVLPNVGSIIVQNILNSLLLNLPNTTTIWLGVALYNNYFSKVSGLYAKWGFKNPYIDFSDPFGNNWEGKLMWQGNSYPIMGLTRPNDYIDPEEINRDEILVSIAYVVTQYTKIVKNLGKQSITAISAVEKLKSSMDKDFYQDCCTLNIQFNKPFAVWLRTISFSASTLNADGSVTQKEVGGAFKLESPKYINDIFVWQVKKENSKIVYGSEESVNGIDSRYNFHSHPREAYIRHKVSVGFPSGPDFVAFLLNVFKNNCVFHSVVTIEGIYIIYINSFWSSYNMKELYNLINNNLNYVYNDVQQITAYGNMNLNFDITIPDDFMSKYCSAINRLVIFPGYPPVFGCNYFTWEEIEKGKIISVSYPVLASTCFAPETDIEIFNKLYARKKSEFLPKLK